MEDKLFDSSWQVLTFLKGGPGTADKWLTHPSMVGSSESIMFPTHGSRFAKGIINETKSGFQVRVLFIMVGSQSYVLVRDGLE